MVVGPKVTIAKNLILVDFKFGGSVRDRHIMYNIMQVRNLILADLNLKVDH